jgi:hypothetical protein
MLNNVLVCITILFRILEFPVPNFRLLAVFSSDQIKK